VTSVWAIDGLPFVLRATLAAKAELTRSPLRVALVVILARFGRID
jgi:hypothetical protein